MRSVVQDRYGNSEVLRLAEVAVPDIRGQEVLVRVRAAGLDRGTQHLMTGKPYVMRLGFGLRRPKTPVSGRDVAGTALQALLDVGRVEAGQAVLVLGASGGVGSYAVQLAKAFGAEITGACSPPKLDLVASLRRRPCARLHRRGLRRRNPPL